MAERGILLQVWVSRAFKANLAAFCLKHGISRSELIRRALSDALDRLEQQPAAVPPPADDQTTRTGTR